MITDIYNALVRECDAEFGADDDVVKAIIAAELAPLEKRIEELTDERDVAYHHRDQVKYGEKQERIRNLEAENANLARLVQAKDEQVKELRLELSAREYLDGEAQIGANLVNDELKRLRAEIIVRDEIEKELHEIVNAAAQVVNQYGNTSWNVGSMRALAYLVQKRQERLQAALGEAWKKQGAE